MVTVWLAVLLAAVPLCCATAEQTLSVCLDDRVGLGLHARQAFDRELAILTQLSLRVADADCSETARVRISVRTHAPARYAGALGLAHMRNARVLPVIELYTANVRRLLEGQGGSARVGRALARVAFHELQHFLRQEPHHDGEGLFKATLGASELAAATR